MWSSVLILTAVLFERFHTYPAHEHGEYDLTFREAVNALEKDNTDKIGSSVHVRVSRESPSIQEPTPTFGSARNFLGALDVKQDLYSVTKKLRYTLQENGSLIISIVDDCAVKERALWTSLYYHMTNPSSEAGPGVASLRRAGGLVVRDSDRHNVRWSSNKSSPKYAGSSVNLNDNGKLATFKDDKELWQSAGSTLCFAFEPSPFYEAQVILRSEEQLHIGQGIQSWNGKISLEFTPSGSFVLYRNCDRSIQWTTNSDGKLGDMVRMQGDGNVVIYTKTAAPVWASGFAANACDGCTDLRLIGGTLCAFRLGKCTWTSAITQEDCPMNYTSTPASTSISYGPATTDASTKPYGPGSQSQGTKRLRTTLQKSGNVLFSIADDCGWEERARWASVFYRLTGAAGDKGGPVVAELEPSGELRIRTLNDVTVKWSSSKNDHLFTGSGLSISDDGKRIVVPDDKLLWGSEGITFCPPFVPSPFHDAQVVLKSEERLRPGQSVQSLSGKMTLKFKMSGEVVMYRNCDGSIQWNTNTEGKGGSMLRMQSDGHLVMYTEALAPIWGSGAWGKPCDACTELRWNDGVLCVFRFGGCVWTSGNSGENCPWTLDDSLGQSRLPVM